MLLMFSVFILIFIAIGFLLREQIIAPYETFIGENAMNIAQAVANIPEIQKNIGHPRGHLIIQPLADSIRKKTKAEFIVVIDMNGHRYSHPIPQRIGKKVVGGDEGMALRGESYISKAIGTLGPSMRAFVPIYRNNQQVGVVLVGILLRDIQAIKRALSYRLMFALALGLCIGMIGAGFLAKHIKRSIRGLEPHEILRLLKEREAFLESVREGILAVDEKGHITLINNAARDLLGIGEKALEEDVEKLVPNTRLPKVISTGKAEFDQEQRIVDTCILTNRIPLKEGSTIIGAIASFRDMTEITAMAQELTGVKKYVEALRVQNHEFLNKLHTISGLVQLGEKNRVISYISSLVKDRKNIMTFITSKIKNPSVGGLLLGKMGRCQELGIQFRIDPESYLAPQSHIDNNVLVIILGNLIENSMRAVLPNKRVERFIKVSLFDESGCIIMSVWDNGVGINKEAINRVFKPGFSTKKDAHAGYGLYNVKNMVEILNGEINIASEKGKYTEVVVNIPNGEIRR